MSLFAQEQPTLVLPDWLEGKAASAGTDYGKRYVAWTLHRPEQMVLFRCTFSWAWITVTERQPWRGEPLWLSAQRRIEDPAGREPFTDRAREAMAREVLPVLARYGFDRYWLELHRAKGGADRSLDLADEAEAEASWWRARADLLRMHSAGMVDWSPCPEPPLGERQFSVPSYNSHGAARRGHEYPAAQGTVNGEVVGWMTKTADLIPNIPTKEA